MTDSATKHVARVVSQSHDLDKIPAGSGGLRNESESEGASPVLDVFTFTPLF